MKQRVPVMRQDRGLQKLSHLSVDNSVGKRWTAAPNHAKSSARL